MRVLFIRVFRITSYNVCYTKLLRLSKISYRSAQKEYFNNPIAQGTIFKEITWGKLPDIRNFKILIKYGDPSYSENTNKKNSHKGVVLMGLHEGKYYVFNCRLDKATNADFVNWYWELDEGLKENIQVYNYVENNTLQDPYYSQVIQPEFLKQSLQKTYRIAPFIDIDLTFFPDRNNFV